MNTNEGSSGDWQSKKPIRTDSRSHDITSGLTSVPLACVAQCNLSFNISFIDLSENITPILWVNFPSSKTILLPLQYSLLEIETLMILTITLLALMQCNHNLASTLFSIVIKLLSLLSKNLHSVQSSLSCCNYPHVLAIHSPVVEKVSLSTEVLAVKCT